MALGMGGLGRFQERNTGHLDLALGSGNAKEGRSPRVIVEGKFTGQDDCLDVWAVAGVAEELIPRL